MPTPEELGKIGTALDINVRFLQGLCEDYEAKKAGLPLPGLPEPK
jgi:hypothetical protein